MGSNHRNVIVAQNEEEAEKMPEAAKVPEAKNIPEKGESLIVNIVLLKPTKEVVEPA